jgi:RNA polymerase sigma factor (sigma-70 family)
MANTGERVPDGGEVSGAETVALDKLTDDELVDIFLACTGRLDRQKAHLCFEALIARYHWLISHIVRNSRFRFPAWDSSDDVISRAIFKVYRGLSKWRREGKLSSFIARITTSEVIDTIRRVGRDRTWDPQPVCPDDADKPSPLDLAPSADPSPESIAAENEQRAVVGRLLSDVCHDWKDSVIVNEYMINSIGAKEIADKYGMSEDLVYQRARRLRVRLVKWLGEHGITSARQLQGGVI